MKILLTSIVITMMLATSIATVNFNDVRDQPILRSLDDFPMQIGHWVGKKDKFADAIYETLGVDDSLLAHYYFENKQVVELYIGFYKSQRKGDLIHSPKNCMPGSGWNIVAIEPQEISLQGYQGKSVRVNKVILKNRQNTQMMFYWFQSRGRVITSEYAQKIYLVLDSITKHRTDGSFIRLISPVTAQNEQQAAKLLIQFSEQLFPLLNQYIPL